MYVLNAQTLESPKGSQLCRQHPDEGTQPERPGPLASLLVPSPSACQQ